METKQTNAFFKTVLHDYYGRDPGERLEPKILVNLCVPAPDTGTAAPNVQVGTSLTLGTKETPPK